MYGCFSVPMLASLKHRRTLSLCFRVSPPHPRGAHCMIWSLHSSAARDARPAGGCLLLRAKQRSCARSLACSQMRIDPLSPIDASVLPACISAEQLCCICRSEDQHVTTVTGDVPEQRAVSVNKAKGKHPFLFLLFFFLKHLLGSL